jgi:chorismate mutase
MNSFSELLRLSEWFDNPRLNDFLLIAGPCSVESEEQILKTARSLKKNEKIQIFRAGLWKPRTRPGAFEGVGTKGIKWLLKAKELTGFKIAVEVANPKHVEICLKNNIDILWLGARTVSNPFSVQEIADSLKGINIPVFIKNPLNPDLELWTGAIERFYLNGLRKLAAVHRGFYPFEKNELRNIPKWEIPIELKLRFENLPIICDPSHIAGKRDFVGEISQQAINLNFDGLMIESHHNPDNALSDNQQQLTPNELNNLLKKLEYRTATNFSDEFSEKLNSYRNQIDSLDAQLIEILSQRMKIVESIGKYKAQNNVTILQLKRWENIIQSRIHAGSKAGLSHDFITGILELIHKESIQKQSEVMNNNKGAIV